MLLKGWRWPWGVLSSGTRSIAYCLTMLYLSASSNSRQFFSCSMRAMMAAVILHMGGLQESQMVAGRRINMESAGEVFLPAKMTVNSISRIAHGIPGADQQRLPGIGALPVCCLKAVHGLGVNLEALVRQGLGRGRCAAGCEVLWFFRPGGYFGLQLAQGRADPVLQNVFCLRCRPFEVVPVHS